MRSCHCAGNPWGGLAKRAWLMREIRSSRGALNVLSLDSGDLFATDESANQATCVLTQVAHMHYDAVVTGDQDLGASIKEWVDINRKAGFWDEANNRSAFPWMFGGHARAPEKRVLDCLGPTCKTLERADLRIGVVAVADAKKMAKVYGVPENASFYDPATAVRRFYEKNRRAIDLLVVLSHLGMDEDRLLAQQCDGIDVIIGGHSQTLLLHPETVNDTVICHPGKNGENLGVLMLSVRPKHKHQSFFKKREPELNSSEKLPSSLTPTGGLLPKWRFAYRIIPLTTSIDEDEQVAGLICEYEEIRDGQIAARLQKPDPRASAPDPSLLISMPSNRITMSAGMLKEVPVCIHNAGQSVLQVIKIRSRSPWMRAPATPFALSPGCSTQVFFEVSAKHIDRFFRCDFTVTSNDPARPVVQYAFKGRVKGPLACAENIDALLSEVASFLPGAEKAHALPPLDPLLKDILEPKGEAPDGSRSNSRVIRLNLFYSPGCSDCDDITERVLPETLSLFKGHILLVKNDITQPHNLKSYLDFSSGITHQDALMIVIDDTIILSGKSMIENHLERTIAERLKLIPSISSGTKK